jgi:hypothetical protein
VQPLEPRRDRSAEPRRAQPAEPRRAQRAEPRRAQSAEPRRARAVESRPRPSYGGASVGRSSGGGGSAPIQGIQ